MVKFFFQNHWLSKSMSRIEDSTFPQRSFFGFCRQYILLLGCVGILSSMIAHDLYAKKQARQSIMSPEKLVNYYRDLRSGRHPVLSASSNDSIPSYKCGLWVTAQLIDQWKNLTVIQRREIQTLIHQNSSEYDTIIGHFRIFYDTIGPNAPTLFDGTGIKIGDALAYVDSVGEIFNHVWDVEIGILGFQQPPLESGDSCYNIYISDLGNGNYGGTNIVDLISGTQTPERYSSNIDIDNDFIGSLFYTKGIQALKVTAAHEFHHAIQFGYGWWGDNEKYAYELTSTWMEDVVYTDVNDYYQYLPDFFGGQQLSDGFWQGLSFNSNDFGGYERSIFAHFLAKKFGANIMKDIWTGMRTLPFLESTDAVLVNRGSNLRFAFAEFTKWNYYTADRADTMNFYPEGIHYPRFRPLQMTAFYNTSSTISGNVESLSSSMYEYDLLKDTITAVIANVDIGNAINRNTTQQKIDVTLSSGLQLNISVDTLSFWGSFLIQSSTQTDVPRLQLNASPNPFRIAEAQWLKLPINQDGAKTAEVFFFTASFQLVYSGFLSVANEDGFRAIEVPTSEVKSKLSSGIYFILAKTANSDYKWKVAVIR
jgi:hypothetical protein